MREVGPRRKIFREITTWADDRNINKAEAIRSRMAAQEQRHYAQAMSEDASNVAQRLSTLKSSLTGLGDMPRYA